MHAIPEPVVVDARAKIIWGESPEKVLAFLQMKGVGDKDAFALIEELVAERAASIREDGLKKTRTGALFVLAPVVYYYATRSMGYRGAKGFAVLLVLGAVGLGKLTNGLSMVLRPRAVKGDLANAED